MFSGDYFRPAAREVFSDLLLLHGAREAPSRIVRSLEQRAKGFVAESSNRYVVGSFQLIKATRSGLDESSETVCYETSDWFVEIFEYPGDTHAHGYDGRPCHYLTLGFGMVPQNEQGGGITGWAEDTIPKQSPLLSNKILWRYTDHTEMMEVFIRARDEIFVPFTLPILLDRQALVSFLERISRERNQRWADEIDTHNSSVYHSMAEEAYRAKKFAEYLAQIRKVPPHKLTKVDRARIAFVSKRV